MNRNKQVIIQTVKIALGVLCLLLISWRLYQAWTPESPALLRAILSPDRIAFLAVAFVLIFVNWGIEVKKWVIITRPVEQVSFFTAWRSVWSGVCVGNLTPGRLGEFAGRILYFEPRHRAKIATSHFVCGITQLLVTLVIGCAGLVFFSKGLGKGVFIITLSRESIFLLLLLITLLRINHVITWLLNLTALKKFNFEGLSYNGHTILKLLGWSLVRYVVFSLQFMLILFACGIEGDFAKLGAAISIMYLILSTIPMVSFIEVGVRAYVSVLLFGMFNQNDWLLTTAATLLWLFNIVIPSVVGYFFILKTDFKFGGAKNGVD